MLTRRRFLLTLPAFAAARPLAAQAFTPPFHKKATPNVPFLVYIGTDTDKGGRGIYLAHFDAVAGHLAQPTLAAATPRPSYFAMAEQAGGRRHLYAVNAVAVPAATVTTFEADRTTGALKQVGQVTSAGAGPAYISLDATLHCAFVADYVGGVVATYRILPSGLLSEPVERLDYRDAKFGKRGPDATRQNLPHPHAARLSPDNQFLLVNDLGSDKISVFTIDPATARLGPPSLFSNNRAGSGPRHLAFHPNGRWVYSINELDSTLDHFLWTATSNLATPQGLLADTGTPVKTTAADFPAGRNTAAEVAISSDGNFLYASNRGEDTLVVFAIAPRDGALSFVQRISCGGKTPRHFTIDPTGRWILCGNQDSASVTVFRRDGATGRLGGPIQTVPIDSPMFTLFA